MIPDDIEAFAADLIVADRIVERAQAGVTPLRLFTAGEEMAFIRAYVAMRHMAQIGADFMAAARAASAQSMSIGGGHGER